MRSVLISITAAVSLYGSGITLPDHFKADFMQKITNTRKKAISYSGKVYFSSPGLMKWMYVKPTKKEVCTDGKALTVVDHDLEQVSTYRMAEGFNLKEIIDSAKVHSKNIYVAQYRGKSYTIQTDNRGRLQSVAYYDELDNKVQIVFKNIHYGKGALGMQNMICSYPKDYDEIRG
ncbi:LolA-like outer membrane lipoprotein chaperone [Sulfurovum sp.]|uniref:LolA-like outer membrane lipoprotein chaperone n=1 Tax=Sulfurovum sp. TaxID=1969726 RepID=UPI0025FA240C|nr:LolA-like outer membrane lipoprotein chaperone [Sulfurovum sp.]